MKLILVRHAECVANLEERAVGHDDSPLTTRGYEQANTLAENLRDERVMAVYSSTLGRAYNTAIPLARHHNLAVNPDSRIIEIEFGATVMTRSLKGTRALIEEARSKGVNPLEYKGHNGESIGEVISRARPFFNQLLERHFGETVVVVAHGGVNRIMIQQLLGNSDEALLAAYHDNTAYSILEADKYGNYQSHIIATLNHTM